LAPETVSSVIAVVTRNGVDQLAPWSNDDWCHTSLFLRVESFTVS